MSASDMGNLSWFKSSYSATNGACVEVAYLPNGVAVRDSKDPNGPVLSFDALAWRHFVAAVRDGALGDAG